LAEKAHGSQRWARLGREELPSANVYDVVITDLAHTPT
jgi:hypothetical protein